MLGNAHLRVWRHLEAAELDKAEAARGTVGIRIMMTKEPGRDRDPADPGLDRILRA